MARLSLRAAPCGRARTLCRSARVDALYDLCYARLLAGRVRGEYPRDDRAVCRPRGVALRFFDRATGEFVGNASFHHLGWSVPKCELGYWNRTSRAGEGLVREGVAALAEMAERDLGARRLEIRCDTRNRRSTRVAEACSGSRAPYATNAATRRARCATPCSTPGFAETKKEGAWCALRTSTGCC